LLRYRGARILNVVVDCADLNPLCQSARVTIEDNAKITVTKNKGYSIFHLRTDRICNFYHSSTTPIPSTDSA
jgi:hypothetical protein